MDNRINWRNWTSSWNIPKTYYSGQRIIRNKS